MLACLASPALADSATLTINNSVGQSDPAALLPRVFTVTGTASTPEQAYVKYRGPGGASCAPSADTDSGTPLDGQQGPFYDGATTENGSFTESQVLTWPTAQTVVFCIWVASSPTTPVTPTTQTITFRAPTGNVGASLGPRSPVAGAPFTVTISGDSEAPETVYATIRSAGGSCAPTAGTDTGTNITGSGQAVNGSFSFTESATESTAGSYDVCLWLASSTSDLSPIDGPATQSFTVSAPVVVPPPPPPSCVVPNPASGTSLVLVEQALLDAHCTVGKVAGAPNPTVKAGGMLSLSPVPLTQEPEGTAIAVEVSTGPACVVPTIAAGTTLTKAKRAIRVAHCAVGKITHVRSARIVKGHVVKATVAAGKIDASNTPVGVVISSGRR